MNLPFLPDLHTAEQDLRFFRDTVFVQCEVWVAGPIEGFIAFRDGWIDHLYPAGPPAPRHWPGAARTGDAHPFGAAALGLSAQHGYDLVLSVARLSRDRV